MTRRAFRLFAWGAAALACGAFAQPSSGHRALLLVSVDGLRPDYVTSPAHAGLKIRNLRRLMREGVYAEGVRGVLPSVTYSSHTSLLTGVHPAKHGIGSNHPFDPADKNPDAWFWYSEDIRMPTLWDAAARAGYVVGSVSWPVSVGSPSIRYNLPEFAGTRTPDDMKMIRALAGPGLFADLAKAAGPYLTDVNHAVPRDWARTRYAIEMIRQKHTRFLTVHLAALDHTQHEKGPFSPPAVAALEEIDGMLGQLEGAMRGEDPGAAVCVVSDHGFAPVSHVFRLDAAFVRAGLIKLKAPRETVRASGLADWQAMPWPAGGSAAIVLRDPKDAVARAKVRQVLDNLAADPNNGIAAILDPAEIARLGGTPAAAFWVDMRPGFSLSAALEGPLTEAVSPRGTHGYSPTHPELNSAFFLAGPGIGKGVNMGVIDMRSIAPALAALLGAPFPTADAPALSSSGRGRF